MKKQTASLGYSLSKLCFEGPDDQLRLTEITQPAILTVSVAAARVLAEAGIEPSFAAGHSLGEYSAHVAAGTLGFADAVRTVRSRGKYMQEAVPVGVGAMAAILALGIEARSASACATAIAEHPGQVCEPANINSPGQVVISGSQGSRGARRRTLQTQGRQARRDASGQRTVPLFTDAARAGSSCRRLARAQVQRSRRFR